MLKNIGIVAGVPQGSVLSPFLFNVYIASVFSVVTPRSHVQIAGFADDLALYSSSSSPQLALSRVQNTVHLIIKELEKWLIKVNVEKTEAILFSSVKNVPIIKIRGKDIPLAPQVKYLGLIIDKK